MSVKMNMVEWMQKWYYAQCDGDWEHEFGVKINTIKNDGWAVTVNLIGTVCEGQFFQEVNIRIDETNWYFCTHKEDDFYAECDPNHLTIVIEIFRDWVEECKKNSGLS